MERTSEQVTSWGRYPVTQGTIVRPGTEEEVRAALQSAVSLIPRGNARSYGDAALHHHMVSAMQLNRILSFDPAEATITCEAGVLLCDILVEVVPKGFFLGVTTGTKFVSIGGAIAADVHGKNHHRVGSFSSFVQSFDLIQPDGTSVTCSRESHPDLFWATFGGMGLTGFILRATLRLIRIESAYICETSQATFSLAGLLHALQEHQACSYAVAWIDSFSTRAGKLRALLSTGEHVNREDLAGSVKNDPLAVKHHSLLSIGSHFPGVFLNDWSMRVFNRLRFERGRLRAGSRIVHYDQFFYPLDKIGWWNRIYGPKGFAQYQFQVSPAHAEAAFSEAFALLGRERTYSFLTVLKMFGQGNEQSPLSFPAKGFALSLDFKMTPSLLSTLNKLDGIVLKYGGKIYLAKDARMTRRFFEDTYPRAGEFRKHLASHPDPGKYQSLLSNRIGLTATS